ncbi:MAG: DJ-1/PfpI family protein [Ruminococcaceae bacterium]|nr:DJ-1/PfpI family protein [Oscillospiraceae bacterium]
MKIALLLANGFEEIEALTPLDVLRRAGVSVDTIGIGSKTIVGAHNIPVIADITDSEANANDYDSVIFPGGMPGSTNLDASEFTDKIIASVTAKGGRLAAICAAPLVLGRRGILNGKKATCYPGFENELKGAEILPLGVVTDGNITTAKGMGVALEFAKELTSLLVSPEKSREISEAIMESAWNNR